MRRGVVVASGVFLALATFVGLLVVSIASPVGDVFPNRSANLFTGPVAIVFCSLAAAHLRGPLRRTWACFAVSMALTNLGDVVWVAVDSGAADPSLVQVAEVLYLSALLPAAVGLMSYPLLEASGMWRVLLVDVVVLACAVLLLCYLLVLRHVHAADIATADKIALSIYPGGAALLASLVVLVMLRTEGPLRLDLLLACVLMLTFSLTGTGYSMSSLPGAAPHWLTLSNVSYAVTPVLVSAAALTAMARPAPRRTLRRHLTGVLTPLLPDLAAMAGIALAIVLMAQDPGTVVLGTVTLVAVGLRQMSQTASGERLRGELEHVVVERTRELAELTEAYRRLDAMKLEFVTAVSHELRTPLASIRGSLEMLHEGDAGELPRPALSMISIASRGSERLSRLVNDIIDLERLESGTFGFSPGHHDVPDLVAEAVRSLECLAAGRSVRFEVDPVEGRVWCDADRIIQVLVNLVGNALKFTPEGSTVTVAARPDGEGVRFTVSDQGPGIPDEHLEAVFDRFHQVEMDESRARGGAGLGLTICRHIVERHAGRIWAENTEHGARIHFTLPQEAPGTVGAVPVTTYTAVA